MANFSNYLETQILTHCFRTGSFTKPSSLYIALSTATISDTTTGGSITEPSGGYSRQQLNPSDSNWNLTSSTASNASEVTFGPATANWGTITHLAIVDASSNGNILYWGQLASAKTVEIDDNIVIEVDGLSISLD